MSRRNDLTSQMLESERFTLDSPFDIKKLTLEDQHLLEDLINIANRSVKAKGKGLLLINLTTDSTTFFSSTDIQADILDAEEEDDHDSLEFLRGQLKEVSENDWSQNVLITLVSDSVVKTMTLNSHFFNTGGN